MCGGRTAGSVVGQRVGTSYHYYTDVNNVSTNIVCACNGSIGHLLNSNLIK